MKLAEERHIAADPAVVWAAVLDPEVLKLCVPGCESLTGSVADGFEAVVVQKVGPVKARFAGKVTLSDIVEGRSLRIAGEGQGGVAGYAKGGANVTMVVNGQTAAETAGDYGDSPSVYQDVKPLPGFDGNYPVIGSWLVNGYACGIGIREDNSPITRNTSRFVPHVFSAGPPPLR